MILFGGSAAIIGGVMLVVATWTHELSQQSQVSLWLGVVGVFVIGFVAPFVFTATTGIVVAFAEPFVFVAVIVALATGQWLVLSPLLVIALICDLVRRSCAQVMDGRAASGVGDPTWPRK